MFSWFEASSGEKIVPKRLLKIHLAIVPLYMLLCVRHEALFLLALCFHLLCWFSIECQLNRITFHQVHVSSISFLFSFLLQTILIKSVICFFNFLQLMMIEFPRIREERSAKRTLSCADFRRAALFVSFYLALYFPIFSAFRLPNRITLNHVYQVFYIFLSFFGTGNIASLNSFEVVWVRCFLSVFSPFTMMILILIKLFIPFVLVTCIFRALNVTIKVMFFNAMNFNMHDSLNSLLICCCCFFFLNSRLQQSQCLWLC